MPERKRFFPLMSSLTIIQQTHIDTQYTYFFTSVYSFWTKLKRLEARWNAAFERQRPLHGVEHTAVAQIVFFLDPHQCCSIMIPWKNTKRRQDFKQKQCRGQIIKFLYFIFRHEVSKSKIMRDLKVSKRKCFLVSLNNSNCCLHHSLSIPTKWGIFFELRNCGTRDCICHPWHSAFRKIFCW